MPGKPRMALGGALASAYSMRFVAPCVNGESNLKQSLHHAITPSLPHSISSAALSRALWFQDALSYRSHLGVIIVMQFGKRCLDAAKRTLEEKVGDAFEGTIGGCRAVLGIQFGVPPAKNAGGGEEF